METYDDITEELKEIGEESDELAECVYFGFCDDCEHCPAHGIYRAHGGSECTIAMALDVAERVRKATAGDVNAWYVLDADGNELHIGDAFWITRDARHVIRAVGHNSAVGQDCMPYAANKCHKVIPDTQTQLDMDADDFAVRCSDMSYEKAQDQIFSLLKRQRKLCEVDK